jgi:Uma2 family endonuclease
MQTRPVTTAAQLLELREPGRCELLRGELRRMSPAGEWHGSVAATVCHLLSQHVRPRQLGRVYGAETGFWIEHDPDTVRAPDAAFVTADRVPANPSAGYFDGPPDLAVEITSPSDRYAEVHEKALFWIARGARLVWVVEPMARFVTVYRRDGSQQTLREDDELTGEDLLPGFAVRVGDLFAG